MYLSNPMIDGQMLYQLSGFIDTDKIHPNACPALVADLSARDQGIIALAFGELHSHCRSFEIFDHMLIVSFYNICCSVFSPRYFLICFWFLLTSNIFFCVCRGVVSKVIPDCSSLINQ